jgi:serine/threonine protein kinase HipA of HipAB toxin-antitoxin module
MVASAAEGEAAFSAATQRQGSAMIAAAQEKGGVLDQQAAEFQAQQADQAGKEALGVAQRSALDRREQIKLTLADLQAKAAASGAGASDRDRSSRWRGKIAQRGEYEALGMMYGGESQKAGYEDVAKGLRFHRRSAAIRGRSKCCRDTL